MRFREWVGKLAFSNQNPHRAVYEWYFKPHMNHQSALSALLSGSQNESNVGKWQFFKEFIGSDTFRNWLKKNLNQNPYRKNPIWFKN